MSRGLGDFSWYISDEMFEKKFNPRAYDFPGAVQRGMYNALEELAEKAEKRMRERLQVYGLSSSGIMDEMVFDMRDNGISIQLVGKTQGERNVHRYMFVEFGTGIRGAGGTPHQFTKSPHNIKWEYDTKGHGEGGWWYPSDADDPNPTLVRSRTAKAGEPEWYAWTKGFHKRPFMYDTWLYLSQITVNTFVRNINKELARMEGMQ